MELSKQVWALLELARQSGPVWSSPDTWFYWPARICRLRRCLGQKKMFLVNGFTSTEVSLLMTVYVFENWRREKSVKIFCILAYQTLLDGWERWEGVWERREAGHHAVGVRELVRDLLDHFSRTWHFVFSTRQKNKRAHSRDRGSELRRKWNFVYGKTE